MCLSSIVRPHAPLTPTPPPFRTHHPHPHSFTCLIQSSQAGGTPALRAAAAILPAELPAPPAAPPAPDSPSLPVPAPAPAPPAAPLAMLLPALPRLGVLAVLTICLGTPAATPPAEGPPPP